jgi:hypothetical protein
MKVRAIALGANPKEIRRMALCLIMMYAALYYPPLFAYYLQSASEHDAAVAAKNAEPALQEAGWLNVESNFFTIYYQPDADLKAICRCLHRRGFYIESGSRRESFENPQEELAYRMDVLFQKAQDLLDIHLSRVKINIKIYKDREALNDEHNRIFGTRSDYKSFYIHKYKTIYTSERDISDSVVAHEMGHAIVDSYFFTTPPSKIAEMVASYIDLHLED